MEKVKFSFRKKSREEEMYIKIVRRLNKNNFKHQSTNINFNFSCTYRKYPYTITIKF